LDGGAIGVRRSPDDKLSGPAVDHTPLRFTARAAAYSAYLMRRNGAQIIQIAQYHGYSKQRASQLVMDGEEVARGFEAGDVSWELSPRSRNALVNWGCGTTPAEVAKLDLTDICGIGTKCRNEITEWLARHAPPV